MTATPGQRAYEAMHASRMKRAGIEDPDYAAWEALDVMTGEGGLRREDMEAAAQAVLNDAFPGLREQPDEATADRDDYAARLKAVDQSWAKLAAERDELREQLRLARAGREQLRAALAVSDADLGREREQVRVARADRNQLRKAVLSLAAAWEDEGADGGVLRDCAGQLRHAAEPPS